jgi:hypothetical protein
MREVGRGLAGQWPRARGSLKQRVERASALRKSMGRLTISSRCGRVFDSEGSAACSRQPSRANRTCAMRWRRCLERSRMRR